MAGLRRFFVPPDALDRDEIAFARREAHHIARVLRLEAGDRVVAFDGTREAEVVLREVSASGVRARRMSPPRASRRPVEIALLQGIARGPRMDLIVRMGTEIGLAGVHPVLTERALPHPGPARVARWRRIAQEAAKQCGRADLPDIHNPVPLADALAQMGPVDLLVVPWEEERRPIGYVVAGRLFASAAILIGPEGGLTADEVSAVRAAGGETVSLGPLILRTETAGIVTAAMLLYERLLRPGGDAAPGGTTTF
ncbi:MAG: 16S rRNA (uracil(1498)-N(3))-methyltransferase [Armatimonadetes bacterium]|nr:16S rRNA (uracil(1498)-N(3))-methyltransferase [Armatimonadota bacterium]